MVTINSWDELLDVGTDIVLEKLTPDSLKFSKNLIVDVRVCGPSWGGFIDYRGANYILELQKAVNDLYSEIHGKELSSRELKKAVTVKVKVVEGSSWFQIDLNAVLEKMVGNMSGDQMLLLAGMCLLTGFGAYTVKKLLDFKVEKLNTKADSSQKDRLIDTVNRALDVIDQKDIAAPSRKLVSRLEPDDTITFPNEKPISAEMAKKRYPRKPKAKKYSGIFDAVYTIKNIDLSDRPVEFTVTNNGLEFKAAAELADQSIKQITRDLEASMKSNESLEIPLQMFIRYNDNKIIGATIAGTGPPRENNKDIMELVQKW